MRQTLRELDFHPERFVSDGALPGGEPIAALYSIVWANKVHFYQSGRKLEVPKGVRPGVTAHALAIRRAIEAKRREYDFLGGLSQYKLQLSLAQRPLVRIRAFRPSIREQARRTAERAMALVRKLRERVKS